MWALPNCSKKIKYCKINNPVEDNQLILYHISQKQAPQIRQIIIHNIRLQENTDNFFQLVFYF